MKQLGGILVDLDRVQPDAKASYIAELRDRLGSTTPIAFWPPFEEAQKPSLAGVLRSSAAHSAILGHLLVLRGSILPDSSVIDALLEAFQIDEMIGFIQPRFSDAACDAIWTLPGADGFGLEQLPRPALVALPETYLTLEYVSACIVVRRAVAATIGVPGERHESLALTLLQEMRSARRRGYRTLTMNRVVVPSSDPRSEVYPSEVKQKGTRQARSLRAHCSDEWFDGGIHRRREALLAQAFHATEQAGLSVLLDCRGVAAHHNGTSEGIFGLLSGIEFEQPGWNVHLLLTPEAAAYHRVRSRFAGMKLLTNLPDTRYAAAICLNQPWHISTVRELHDRALVIAFNILDTIAWDVVYLSNPGIDRAWSFISRHADGLLFNSYFTERRFAFRFPIARRVHRAVTHHSLSADEYQLPGIKAAEDREYILIFGNAYEHKGVGPAVELLNKAFPFAKLEVLGAKGWPLHNVNAVPSGHIASNEIDRLIANARIVIFPSHYEGFGLPVVKALAYGRTVVVRASSLWDELAGLMRMPGKLSDYVTPTDLVEVVGQVLACEPFRTLPLGTRLAEGESAPDWRQCARKLIAATRATILEANAQHWYLRDRALDLASQD
jgi:glycosyltransferase involved in cell wall biosynthesis